MDRLLFRLFLLLLSIYLQFITATFERKFNALRKETVTVWCQAFHGAQCSNIGPSYAMQLLLRQFQRLLLLFRIVEKVIRLLHCKLYEFSLQFRERAEL